MTNLVEKAISSRITTRHRKEGFSPEEVELALAWADGYVGTSDVHRVITEGKPVNGSVYLFLARALKQYLNSLPKQ